MLTRGISEGIENGDQLVGISYGGFSEWYDLL